MQNNSRFENQISKSNVERLSEQAWNSLASARVLGKTKVGCAALSDSGNIFSGCNIEHKFRSHDIHAEINALSTLVANGEQSCSAILVAAHRQRFTPCGACLDWIFEIGGLACMVGFQAAPDSSISWYTADELMPYYPE